MEFLLSPRSREAFTQLTEAVRRGGTALGEGSTVAENPEWVTFARAMMPLMRMPSQMMAAELRKGGEAHKVLDIAAGHGMYGIGVAKENPDAQVYAADWKNVLEVAKANAQAMGIGDRYHLIPGSAFETDFGSDYDLVLIPNFLHHFDVPTCTSFMKKVRGVLKPGGRAAILEFIPNARSRDAAHGGCVQHDHADRILPAGTRIRSRRLESMAKNAGFARAELWPREIGFSRLAIAYA